MAVGPTESMQSPKLFRMSSTQVDISNRIMTIMGNTMRGVTTTRVSPENAIPPANAPQKVRTAGLGSQLDLDA